MGFNMAGMADRFDPVFPETGGMHRLAEVRRGLISNISNPSERAGRTFFHPVEAEHVRKVLQLLDDDEEAKSTVMSVLAFAQMKSDVAGF